MASSDDTEQKDLESWTYEDVKSADFLVLRNGTTNYVEDIIAPNGLQIGLLDESFEASLFVTGPITGSSYIIAEQGFTGSLQKLYDGTDYLRAGTNMTVTNNADGSITLASTNSSTTLSNVLTVGDGLQLDSGTTFNAAAARTISLDLKSNGGLKITSAELEIEPADFAGSGLTDDGSDNLKVDIAGQSAVTAAGDDYVLISDTSNSGNLKKTLISSIQSVASFNIAGLSTALTDSTVAKEDLFPLADVNDSNNVKKITLEDIVEFISDEDGGFSGLQENDGKLRVHIKHLNEEVINVSEDYIAFMDESQANDKTRRESIPDFVAAIRGTATTTGLSSTAGVLM